MLVDGEYSDWSPWTECSVTCSLGSQVRSRSCTNPAPAHGGLPCEGDEWEVQDCDSNLPGKPRFRSKCQNHETCKGNGYVCQ